MGEEAPYIMFGAEKDLDKIAVIYKNKDLANCATVSIFSETTYNQESDTSSYFDEACVHLNFVKPESVRALIEALKIAEKILKFEATEKGCF